MSELCRGYGLSKWGHYRVRGWLLQGGKARLAGNRPDAEREMLRSQVAELERAVGRLTMENQVRKERCAEGDVFFERRGHRRVPGHGTEWTGGMFDARDDLQSTPQEATRWAAQGRGLGQRGGSGTRVEGACGSVPDVWLPPLEGAGIPPDAPSCRREAHPTPEARARAGGRP